MKNLLNPNISDAKRLQEFKKYMISQSRDFFCPVTGECFDFRKVEIIKIGGRNLLVDRSALPKLDPAKFEHITHWDKI